MMHLSTRNVNTAYSDLMMIVKETGKNEETRNGVARALQHPILIEFSNPYEKVLFDAERNANPFFHLMEAMWMIAGRNDVKFLDEFNSNMKSYSDDGRTFNAAYGHRWREYFGMDQIAKVCDILKRNPNDRRCVITMWDGNEDLKGHSKDHPCNTQIMCRIVNGFLDFTITNRSNDLVFGLCGANAVHMSVLQEYMAACIGVNVGRWYHLTNNLHVYERHFDLMDDMYWGKGSEPYPERRRMIPPGADMDFENDCYDLCNGVLEFRTGFFKQTVWPALHSWRLYKQGYVDLALIQAATIGFLDWRRACVEWLQRAKEKKNA
jgi:thymidylate synthase